ncbi:MAG: hypothetical protein II198_06000, partial [Bacteroidaceae bacterium]|nr:hypothetical protein [Bacteroidaceae bacterium]
VEEIGSYAFDKCRNLTSVYCLPVTPPIENISFAAYVQDIYVPAKSVEKYKEEWWNLAGKIRAFDF